MMIKSVLVDRVIAAGAKEKIEVLSDASLILESGSICEITERENKGTLKIILKQKAQAKLFCIGCTSKKEIFIGADSSIEIQDISSGSSVTCTLNGRGAECRLNSRFLCEGNLDQQYSIIHNAPETKGEIIVKGVLEDNAIVKTIGFIKMSKNSSGSKGYQKADILLLGEKADARVIPKLEVDNDNVKCGHAVTISSIDKEMLFYMASRGLNEKNAVKLIAEGFLR